MSTPVTLPALGESVTEGTITRWLKSVGDTVEVDEPLLEVSTDKVDTEIPSPVAGTLLEIKAEEDETVEVGAELAIIGDEGEGGADDDSADDEDADDGDEGSADQSDARRNPTRISPTRISPTRISPTRISPTRISPTTRTRPRTSSRRPAVAAVAVVAVAALR